MIDAKMLKGTGPYNQMRAYINAVHKDLTPQQRAGKFTALLKLFVANLNREGDQIIPDLIDRGFIWAEAPEGHKFWENINRYPGMPKEKVEEKPVVVWPEGYAHYNPRINQGKGAFFNSAGRIVNEGHMDWNHPGVAFGHWSVAKGTIKRPENPLPNGKQWEKDYTHANIHAGVLFQFNDEGYKWEGKVRQWREAKRKKEWFEKCTTIKRYPDNQPLVLEAPVVAPKVDAPRVEARVAPPVQAVPQAIVEPPKAAPVKHKPVGWWN